MSIVDQLRAKATEQRTAATVQIESDKFAADPKVQLVATVGFVTASVYDALAELAESLPVVKPEQTLAQQRRTAILARNDAIRKAAARNDWAEFDRLAAGQDPTPPAG